MTLRGILIIKATWIEEYRAGEAAYSGLPKALIFPGEVPEKPQSRTQNDLARPV